MAYRVRGAMSAPLQSQGWYPVFGGARPRAPAPQPKDDPFYTYTGSTPLGVASGTVWRLAALPTTYWASRRRGPLARGGAPGTTAPPLAVAVASTAGGESARSRRHAKWVGRVPRDQNRRSERGPQPGEGISVAVFGTLVDRVLRAVPQYMDRGTADSTGHYFFAPVMTKASIGMVTASSAQNCCSFSSASFITP